VRQSLCRVGRQIVHQHYGVVALQQPVAAPLPLATHTGCSAQVLAMDCSALASMRKARTDRRPGGGGECSSRRARLQLVFLLRVRVVAVEDLSVVDLELFVRLPHRLPVRFFPPVVPIPAACSAHAQGSARQQPSTLNPVEQRLKSGEVVTMHRPAPQTVIKLCSVMYHPVPSRSVYCAVLRPPPVHSRTDCALSRPNWSRQVTKPLTERSG
jgi:hypothetical protein